ncbi:25S rRNA (uridine-N(3))-methyltransferase [Cytospora mali]|uniref:25S rRNA (Uridine-N(3))-methyltransferase n=1 Tax=Cytospora mali TaxID=578113 RepID=A0A194VLB2_CYTMA|nr:25S rRNA (uridine-N(3))-methyltransferase [Valsa mali]
MSLNLVAVIDKAQAPKAGKPEAKASTPKTDLQPTIPFSPEDAILLIGEGDLSFSKALIDHHYCANVTATVLEPSLEELTAKYPHVNGNIEAIEAEGSKVVYGVDAKKMGPFVHRAGRESVGSMDRIIFNFPHVGGKSTDVNRQVRYNQELLVGFFKRALLSLAPGGTIIVTLFEGEPYTLWNIRDLARHSGLQVERSFRFQASAYPGYSHARTLGVVKNKHGDVGGGWKGEDRPARSYVFVRKDESPKPVTKKRKRTVFNFPHVGGKSTDVNRQVRYNQELLVGFFKRALLSLAPGGTIIVTLFEGEPYTLWNIRDLARHSGLQVERSFRFQASAYPGYSHARTLGVVKNKHGDVGGGWKGEDRPARSYVFVRKDESPKPVYIVPAAIFPLSTS